MALPRELALDSSQIDEMMTSLWNMRIASVGPRKRINLTPSRTRALASELRGEGVLTSERQGNGATAPELFSLPSTDGNLVQAPTTRTTRTRRRTRSKPAAEATSS